MRWPLIACLGILAVCGCGEQCEIPTVIDRLCDGDECECENGPVYLEALVDLAQYPHHFYLVDAPSSYGTTDHVWVSDIDPGVVPSARREFKQYGAAIVACIDGAVVEKVYLDTQEGPLTSWQVNAAGAREILFRSADGDTLSVYRPGAAAAGVLTGVGAGPAEGGDDVSMSVDCRPPLPYS